jgi:hypothetical protein
MIPVAVAVGSPAWRPQRCQTEAWQHQLEDGVAVVDGEQSRRWTASSPSAVMKPSPEGTTTSPDSGDVKRTKEKQRPNHPGLIKMKIN